MLNLVRKEDSGYRQIDGKGYSTITSVRSVVKPAFQMAYNEDIIRRNPFDFKLMDVVPDDSQGKQRNQVENTPIYYTICP